MNYYVEVKQLCAGYNKKPVVKNIEIALKRGEILTLIGPNGAGKSTVLRSIAGQLEIIGGVVSIDNQNLASISPKALSQKMSVVWTDRIRAEMMTCEDVVATGRYPYTGSLGVLTKNDRLAVDEAIRLTNVSDIRDKAFSKISDGQRQRIMLARAICQEPEIIILDEPTSYLDIRYKLEFLSILQKLCRQKGLTVIMSLHELELAQKVSDRILCVNGEYAGRLGTPCEIFKDGYISELFNISSGSFDDESADMELEAAKGETDIFVISGGGCGRAVYRRLQREGRAFSTGILYENDIDYPVARALSSEVIKAVAFEPVPDSAVSAAKRMIDKCSRVICCKNHFGSYERANEELLCYARETGKLVEMP